VTLTLAPRNGAPEAVADGPFTNPEDSGEFVFNAASNDTDLDGDTLFVQSVGVPNPSTAGTVQVIEESGIRVIEFSPALHFNGTVEIPYTVIDRADFADPEALTASSTLTLEYTPVNDAPVAVADSFTDAFEDIAYTGNVLENDTDVDEGDSLTASLIAGSAVNGAVTLNSDGSFTFTPVADFNGDASFSYTTQDAAGEPSLSAVSVTITFAPVDDNPVATADSYTGATEDTDFVVADVDGVLGNDSDVDVGDTRTAHVTGVAVGGSVNLSPAGGFTFTPDADFFGVASFQYVARDTTDGGDDVALDSAPVTVTIDFANTADAPVAVNDPSAESYTVDEDSSLTISAVAGLLVNDFDVDN